jgi:hypothetical protein
MSLPLIILGGSDRKPGPLPPAGRGHHALAAYKGAEIQVGGRPLVALLCDRLRSAPELDPIVIAGPARVYAGLAPGVEVVDTDGPLAENLRRAVDAQLAAGRRGALAFTTCDVLPDPLELRRLLEDYESGPECAAWYPLIRVPADRARLGAFGWKPEYRIAPDAGSPPTPVLPGHLVVVDPAALRLRFLYRLLELAYRTRNRPVRERHRRIAGHFVLGLLLQDLLHLAALRAPDVTWTVLTSGRRMARGLAEGTLTSAELGDLLARIALRARYRRRFPERGVRLPVLDGLSFAEDIDTEEEARQIDAAWSARARLS